MRITEVIIDPRVIRLRLLRDAPVCGLTGGHIVLK